MDSSYALFTLFFPEDIFNIMSSSTNAYASYHRGVDEDSDFFSYRHWQTTNEHEIRVFIGALIYMGAHRSPRVDRFFRRIYPMGLAPAPIHVPMQYMTNFRFEQLKRYIHISGPRTPDPNKKEWWYRLEPLARRFRENCQRYYTPGSSLSVDEIMVRCYGRTSHTYRIPHKPIKQGYKIFCLAEHGYIWTFSWSSRQMGIEESFKYPNLSPTGSMVMKMMDQLPREFSERKLVQAYS